MEGGDNRALEIIDQSYSAGLVALSFLPVFGSPAAQAMGELRRWQDQREFARLKAIVEEIGTAVAKLTHDHVRPPSEEAQTFVEAVLESAMSARHFAKHAYYAQLAAGAIVSDSHEAASMLYLETLDRLTEPHLALLRAVVSGPVAEAKDYHTVGTEAYEWLARALPGVSDHVIARLWADLATVQVLDSWQAALVTEDSYVEDSGRALTAFGSDFIQRIGSPPR